MTCKWFINHGDRLSPQRIGLFPLSNGLFMAYKWGLLTTNHLQVLGWSSKYPTKPKENEGSSLSPPPFLDKELVGFTFLSGMILQVTQFFFHRNPYLKPPRGSFTKIDAEKIQLISKVHFSPTAECYGVFAQYRFRCVLGELGRFWEGTGFREPKVVPCFDMFRWVLTGSAFRRWFQVSKVLEFRVLMVFDGFWQFRRFRVRWGSEGSGTLKVHLWRKTRRKKNIGG